MVGRAVWPSGLRGFADKWDEFKLRGGYLDFTDLIEQALERVDSIDGCRVLIVDEAQDMSKLEFALARKWGAHADQFVIVGDPDQNLYEWRGADPAAFYSTDAASTRVLSQSYRVPHAVHRAAVDWIRNVDDRIDAEYRPRDAPGRLVRQGFHFNDPDPLIEDVLLRVTSNHICEKHEWTEDGHCRHCGCFPQDAMILASCGYMLNPLCKRLRERGIPFHNPYRSTHGGWNPLRSANRLLAFLHPDPAVWGSEASTWTYDDLRRWTGVLQSKQCLVRGAKTFFESKCVQDKFGESRSMEKPTLSEVLAWFKPEHHDAVYEMDLNWYEEHLKHADRKSQAFALAVARRQGGAKLRERPRIIVGTIHSVKGGEADSVYLFPDLSPVGYWEGWKRRGQGRNSVVRQFYVGMTRAKDTLTLCEPSTQLAVDW
jgi:superfamily I DNA/RNA helicase